MLICKNCGEELVDKYNIGVFFHMPTEKQQFLKEWKRDHSGDSCVVKRGKIAWDAMQRSKREDARKELKQKELSTSV